MDDDYLANSLLTHIEGEIIGNYTYDDIITDFKDLKERSRVLASSCARKC
jgi:hypothetical protein